MGVQRISRPLLAVLLIAFFLRGSVAVGLQWALENKLHRPYLIMGDADGYWKLGADIAAGREYSVYDDPPKRLLRMPGFPAILSLSIAAFGERYLPARILLAAIGTLACLCVYWLGRELFDHSVGLAAAAIAAVTPTFVGYSSLILSETAFAAALTANLVFVARIMKLLRSEAPWSALIGPSIGCGSLIAVANYMRPSWLLAVPIFATLLLLAGRFRSRAVLSSAIIALTTFLCIVPWGLRNERVTGHFIAGTLIMGISLYDGLNPNATGESSYAAFEPIPNQQLMTEYEIDQAYRKQAIDYARNNPGRAVELAFLKLKHYWRPWFVTSGFSHWSLQAAALISFIPGLSLAAYSLWKLRPGWEVAAVTCVPLFYFCALHMIFTSSPRYRLPAEYPLVVLSAAGLCTLLKYPVVCAMKPPNRELCLT